MDQHVSYPSPSFLDWNHLMPSVEMPLTSFTPEELRTLPERIRNECETIGSSYSMTIVLGRKP